MTVRQITIVDRDFLGSDKAFIKKSCVSRLIQNIYDVFYRINYFLKCFFIEHFSSQKTSIEKLIDKLANNRIIAMKKCSQKYSYELLQDKSDLSKDSSEKQIDEFMNHIKHIKNLIEKENIKILSKHSNDIRKEIDKALGDDVYTKNKNSNNFAINFLQELCNCLFLQSNGSDEISEYAQTMISIEKPKCTFKELGDELDGVYKNIKDEPNRNSLGSTVGWLITSPIKGLNMLLTRMLPLETNQYQINNNETVVQDFVLNQSSTRFYLGPNPAVGNLFSGHLDYLKKHQFVHLHHNLQHLSKPGEEYRIYELLRKEERYKGTLRLFTTPMDGKAWKCCDDRFLEFKDPDEFHLNYAKFAIANDLDCSAKNIEDISGTAFRYHEVDREHDNGFYLGADVMSDSQFKQAFVLSQNAMQKMHSKSPLWQALHSSKEGRKRLSKMMQISVQGFLSIGALLKLQHDLKDGETNIDQMINSSFSQACKQDIDRGIALNIVTRLFYHLLSNEELTKKDVELIVGTVIGRAKLVEGRIMIFDRFEPLSDLIHFIADSQTEFKQALAEYSRLIQYDKSKEKGLFYRFFVEPFSKSSYSMRYAK